MRLKHLKVKVDPLNPKAIRSRNDLARRLLLSLEVSPQLANCSKLQDVILESLFNLDFYHSDTILNREKLKAIYDYLKKSRILSDDKISQFLDSGDLFPFQRSVSTQIDFFTGNIFSQRFAHCDHTLREEKDKRGNYKVKYNLVGITNDTYQASPNSEDILYLSKHQVYKLYNPPEQKKELRHTQITFKKINQFGIELEAREEFFQYVDEVPPTATMIAKRHPKYPFVFMYKIEFLDREPVEFWTIHKFSFADFGGIRDFLNEDGEIKNDFGFCAKLPICYQDEPLKASINALLISMEESLCNEMTTKDQEALNSTNPIDRYLRRTFKCCNCTFPHTNPKDQVVKKKINGIIDLCKKAGCIEKDAPEVELQK